LEPATTGLWAKTLEAIQDWPLWFLVAVALSLSVFASVPNFRHLVSPATNGFVPYAVVVAWIFVVTRGAQPTFKAVRLYHNHREVRHHFYVTPIEDQCHWGIARQPDGSSVTQFSPDFMVKNRSTEPLHLMSARVVKPKMPGEILSSLLTTRSPTSDMHGTPAVSGYFIAPGETLPASAMILIKGIPKQKDGPLRATIQISDADGHHESVTVQLKFFSKLA
jgi:hypothetical protein